ncbi:hypothetical protein [Streptomyces lydicus]|uniref:hypothetical protein n=1 Tax=Streptomyces lydicus TaxID=47763 RepID=UPI00344A4A82
MENVVLRLEDLLFPSIADVAGLSVDVNQVVRELARAYGAHLLAADSMFAELAATTGPEY